MRSFGREVIWDSAVGERNEEVFDRALSVQYHDVRYVKCIWGGNCQGAFCRFWIPWYLVEGSSLKHGGILKQESINHWISSDPIPKKTKEQRNM
jgi:hypothetical protein